MPWTPDYQLATRPWQVSFMTAFDGDTVTYTNDTSCIIVCTGIVWCLQGAAGSNGALAVNTTIILSASIGASVDVPAINGEITGYVVLEPGDQLVATYSGDTSFSLLASGFIVNHNG